MSAPKGNEFWKLRSTHGRKRLFETPELMWEAACEYFQWCIDNPLLEEQIVKYKDTYEKVTISKMRPFTLQGLSRYLNCNTVYFNHFETSLAGKEDEVSKGFSKIVTRIRETIYDQKFSGAASGFFNSNIIARDLGIADKKEVEAEIKIHEINFVD